MKKILFLTLIAGALLLTASCDKKGVIYEFPSDAQLLSFPSDKASFSMAAEDGNKITVYLYRGNTNGTASVPFSFEDGTGGVFAPAKSTFDFENGQGVASVDITYPDIKAFGGEIYEMTLSLNEEKQVSPSGKGKLKITAQRKLTPVLLGEGVWTSDWFDGETWPQEIYTTEEAPNYYILPDCWEEGVSFSFTVVDGALVWPETFDSGLLYSSDNPDYGNIWLNPVKTYIEDGVLYLLTEYALPAADHIFGGGPYTESFTIPEGVEIK